MSTSTDPWTAGLLILFILLTICATERMHKAFNHYTVGVISVLF